MQAVFWSVSGKDPSKYGRTWRSKGKNIVFILLLLSLNMVIIAIARPQKLLGEEKIETEGIDIMLAIDISRSMEDEDFEPNRLEAVKEVAKEFVYDRPNDRLGLVSFCKRKPYTMPTYFRP